MIRRLGGSPVRKHRGWPASLARMPGVKWRSRQTSCARTDPRRKVSSRSAIFKLSLGNAPRAERTSPAPSDERRNSGAMKRRFSRDRLATGRGATIEWPPAATTKRGPWSSRTGGSSPFSSGSPSSTATLRARGFFETGFGGLDGVEYPIRSRRRGQRRPAYGGRQRSASGTSDRSSACRAS